MGFLLIAAAIFAAVMTYFKPAFYWDSRKAMRMRKLFGDTGTSIFYYVIAAFLLVIGVLEVTNILSLQ